VIQRQLHKDYFGAACSAMPQAAGIFLMVPVQIGTITITITVAFDKLGLSLQAGMPLLLGLLVSMPLLIAPAVLVIRIVGACSGFDPAQCSRL